MRVDCRIVWDDLKGEQCLAIHVKLHEIVRDEFYDEDD